MSEFLLSEPAHAERHLARIRRIQAQRLHELEAAGRDEATVYERLTANKAYRQLQRDEVFYQQMWLRLHRHLQRIPATANATPIDAATNTSAKPEPFRKPPTPTRNQPGPCGSTFKYKRCCGNPLKGTNTAAA
jgi:uncharacterized protein YecA (UPF0149 family)